MKYLFSIVTLSSCNMMLPKHKYLLSENHVPTIDGYREYLSNHHLFVDVELDYSVKSLGDLEMAMASAFVENNFDPQREITHYFEWAIVVYVGETYLFTNNQECEWLSTNESRFIPFGLYRNGKIASRFTTLVSDVLREYPYQIKASGGNKSEMFDLKLMYDYIPYELDR